MKQNTTPDKTAKLIEMGFDRPKFEIETQLCNIKGQPLRAATIVGDYSIGELIELLPKHIFPDNVCFDLQILANQNLWVVKYTALFYGEFYSFCSNELTDALCDMIVKLKEKGVI